jgi:hypothetical protein
MNELNAYVARHLQRPAVKKYLTEMINGKQFILAHCFRV